MEQRILGIKEQLLNEITSMGRTAESETDRDGMVRIIYRPTRYTIMFHKHPWPFFPGFSLFFQKPLLFQEDLWAIPGDLSGCSCTFAIKGEQQELTVER